MNTIFSSDLIYYLTFKGIGDIKNLYICRNKQVILSKLQTKQMFYFSNRDRDNVFFQNVFHANFRSVIERVLFYPEVVIFGVDGCGHIRLT